jgi:hypothetical protein
MNDSFNTLLLKATINKVTGLNLTSDDSYAPKKFVFKAPFQFVCGGKWANPHINGKVILASN